MEGSMIIQHSDSFATLSRRNSIRCVWAGLLACVLFAPGCSALKPVRGVPAAYLPDQFHGPSRNNQRTIDLSLLVRPPVDQHRVAAGDVLSIYIPGVLGHQAVDINSPGVEPPILSSYYSDDPPTLGYPITVRDDHTIALPQLPPLNVYNLTLHQVEQRPQGSLEGRPAEGGDAEQQPSDDDRPPPVPSRGGHVAHLNRISSCASIPIGRKSSFWRVRVL